MRNQRVSLHLSESDATRSLSSLSADDDNSKKAGNFVHPDERGFFVGFGIEIRTFTGCRVNGSIGPVVLTWNLSNTMCRRRW